LAGISPDRENVTLVATAGALTRQSKLSLSSEDEALHVKRGSGLDIYVPDAEAPNAVRWAVLNCHDYTHVDLLKTLQEERIELLIVVTYNTATRLYWQYAIADVHRLFCYVAIANVAELGGSGVFAPFRRVGREKNAQIGAGGQIFGARGAGEFAVDVELDIEGIRSIRKEFSEHGFQAPQIQRSRGSIYTAMVPSEHYMDTLDRKAGAPELNQVSDIPTDWNVDKARIAVAQLNHIGLQAYIDSKYRIRNHPTCGNFEYLLLLKLAELETRCRNLGQTDSGSLLDLLAFPEVFIPRSFLGTLQSFSDRMGAIVVAGLDYPDGGEETNANECAVIRPRASPVFYRKITRSQYDAHRDNAGNRMPMRRGHELLRFVNDQGRGFGVLICYDFSHTDLMWNLNLLGREMPLDLTVVVAHNPFGDLYRSCCIADAHRFYQYILMCNVAEYGGSGVFGPVRTSGARQVILDAGKGIEAIALAELNLRDLHESRCSPDQGLHHGDFMRRPGVFQRRWP
jgi:predicted amidohydrolase